MENLPVMILQGITLFIFIDAILSWMQPATAFPRSLTAAVTDPLYKPIRAIISPKVTGGLDFSPVIVLVLLQFLLGLL